eukprot:CAMPEP_0170258590 /NCGR_PEP_ID=MMETSP0116_2-20130129/29161_1 /TAXON_ID=400756 /ORGANISM="Durinskia baltica, Strain CSIRO CS-38" /LENGTH=47 /DNA_ID= /DNA_START= /DNA_END= /DNA_ORIENTATION=
MFLLTLTGFVTGVIVGVYQTERVKPAFDRCLDGMHKLWQEKVLAHKQ